MLAMHGRMTLEDDGAQESRPLNSIRHVKTLAPPLGNITKSNARKDSYCGASNLRASFFNLGGFLVGER